jgi:hypothetical protein
MGFQPVFVMGLSEKLRIDETPGVSSVGCLLDMESVRFYSQKIA